MRINKVEIKFKQRLWVLMTRGDTWFLSSKPNCERNVEWFDTFEDLIPIVVAVGASYLSIYERKRRRRRVSNNICPTFLLFLALFVGIQSPGTLIIPSEWWHDNHTSRPCSILICFLQQLLILWWGRFWKEKVGGINRRMRKKRCG